MKKGRTFLSILLILAMLSSMMSGFAVLAAPQSQSTPINLVLGKTPTTSAYTAQQLSKLTDGNHDYMSDNWGLLLYGAGSTQNNVNYYEFSFDTVTELNMVKLYRSKFEPTILPRDIAIDVKLENGEWKRVAANYNINYDTECVTNSSGGEVTDSSLTFTFAKENCVGFRISSNRQRTRVLNNALTSTYNWRLSEIEAYYDPSVTTYSAVETPDDAAYAIPILTLTNLAAGKTVTTNGYATNVSELSRLTDGGTASGAPVVYFSTIAGTTATNTKVIYFDIDLGSVQSINRVDLTLFLEPATNAMYNDYGNMKRDPRDVAIDVLGTDGQWVRVAEAHNQDYGKLTGATKHHKLNYYFEMVQGSKVRITFNRTQVSNYLLGQTGGPLVSPSEVAIYCDYGATPAQYTGIQQATVANTEIPRYSLQNYALNGTVTSDGRENTAAGPYTKLTNGTSYTDRAISYYWEGGNANKTGKNIRYYDIAFTAPALINQVTIDYFNHADGKNHREQDIALDVLLEDDTYVRVAEKHNMADVATTTKTSITLSFEAKTAKGIRITANCIQSVSYTGTTANAAFLAYSEVSAYYNSSVPGSIPYTGIETATVTGSAIPLYTSGEPTPPTPPNPPVDPPVDPTPDASLTNYALNGTVTSNGEEHATAGPWDKLTNGATNDRAISYYWKGGSANKTGNNIRYYDIAFTEPALINHVMIDYFNNQDGIKHREQDIALDVLLADGTYVRVAEKHDMADVAATQKQTLHLTFEAKQAVGIRITANCIQSVSYTSDAGSAFLAYAEVLAYNNPKVPSDVAYTGVEAASVAGSEIPYSDPILPNLAADKKVTANDILSVGDPKQGTDFTYKAEFLTDGNNDYLAGTETNAITKWVSTTKQGWFEVDFGKKVTFNQVAVFLTQWERANLPKDMAVDVRDADGVYHRVAEMHNIDYAGKKKLTFSFNEVEAVAFRVTGNASRNENSGNFRLMELEAYNYPNMPEYLITGTVADVNQKYNIAVPEPILTNLASGKPVTANEIVSVGDPKKGTDYTYKAEFLTDGTKDYKGDTKTNAITKYTTSTKQGWFEVDFGKETKFNQVAVFLTQWEPKNLPKEIAIDVRLADGTYRRVAEMHNIDYTALRQLTFSFPDTTGVAFRVTGNAARNEKLGNFRLVELEAYYYPNMPAEKQTGTQKDSNAAYNIAVPEPILTNLALGKKVTANETLTARDGKGKDITYHASYLTDGNTDYYAGTEKNAITQWISPSKIGWFEVDFGKTTTFNQVSVFLTQWEKEHRPLDIAIDVRLSNGTYKRVAELHNIKYSDSKQITFSFETVQAAAFRVTGNASRNAKTSNFRLMELEAYYYPNMPKDKITGVKKDSNAKYNIELPEPMMKNLAEGMEVKANKEVKGYEAIKLTDGFKTYNSGTDKTAITGWIGKKKIGWFEVSFKNPTKINKVEATLSRWETANLPKDVALEVKLEDGTYVRVAEMHDIDYKGIRALTFYFAEQTAVAFRIIGNASRNTSSGNFRLLELEAFYYPGLPESKYTGVQEDENPLYNIKAEDLIGGGSTNTSGSATPSVGTNVYTPTVAETARNPFSDTTGLLVIFCVTAGFVLLTFAGGAGATVGFVNSKIKKRRQSS